MARGMTVEGRGGELEGRAEQGMDPSRKASKGG